MAGFDLQSEIPEWHACRMFISCFGSFFYVDASGQRDDRGAERVALAWSLRRWRKYRRHWAVLARRAAPLASSLSTRTPAMHIRVARFHKRRESESGLLCLWTRMWVIREEERVAILEQKPHELSFSTAWLRTCV